MTGARVLISAAVAAVAVAAASAAPAATPPGVKASAYEIVDARTGEILAASNPHARLPIASITKLMTVLVVLEHHRLSDVVDVDPRAAGVGESSIYLRPHDRLTVADLVKGALIQSANDAADALALSVAPSFKAFAALMNEKARDLGLTDTNFIRPDGLDAPGEYSSAADVTALARAALRVRVIRDDVGEETADIAGGRVLHTWDDLLGRFPGVIGGKTGHTDRAGWCQVVAAQSQGVTVYVTLLGGPTRYVRDDDLASLLAWGLARFRVADVIASGRVYAHALLPYGQQAMPLVAQRPSQTVVRIDRPLVERVVVPRVLSLPVTKGQVVGSVEILEGSRVVARSDLVAGGSAHRPGSLGRLGWYTTRTWHRLLGLF